MTDQEKVLSDTFDQIHSLALKAKRKETLDEVRAELEKIAALARYKFDVLPSKDHE